MTAPVEYALAYAGAGYRVLPVYVFKVKGEEKTVKAPASKKSGLAIYCPAHSKKSKREVLRKCRDCKGGVVAATTDPDRVRELWSGRNARCHVGVVPPPGVIVVDDDGHCFDEKWAGRPHVVTPSGGRHYYLRLSDGQDGLFSENGIIYREDPEGLVDIRVSGDRRFYVIAPSGTSRYKKVNGATLDPARLRPLPAKVYDRLREAPRKAGSGLGGLGLGKYQPGVESATVGNAYDRREGVVEEWLESAGWTDEDDRWIRPGGGDGSAKVSESNGVWFANVHTYNDDRLDGGRFYTASMLRCVFEFDGNWKRTYLALLDEGAFNDKTNDPKEIFK